MAAVTANETHIRLPSPILTHTSQVGIWVRNKHSHQLGVQKASKAEPLLQMLEGRLLAGRLLLLGVPTTWSSLTRKDMIVQSHSKHCEGWSALQELVTGFHEKLRCLQLKWILTMRRAM